MSSFPIDLVSVFKQTHNGLNVVFHSLSLSLSTALHPFVRMRIKGSTFVSKRSFVAIKKFLAPIDVVKRSSQITELIKSGVATMQFQPIQLQASRAIRPWSSPDGSYGIGPFNQHDDNHFDTMPNFVFNFGCIISLPNRSRMLYRLQLQSNDQVNHMEDGLFLLSKSFLELCQSIHFDEKTYLSESQQPDVIEITGSKHSSRSLPAILPDREPCLPPSVLKMAKVALKRPSMIIHGDTGTGKTFTSLLIAAIARLARGDDCFYLNCQNLRDSHTIRMKTILTELETTFNEAHQMAPAVVILDNLDAIAPNVQSGNQMDNSSMSHDTNPTEVDQSKLISDVLCHLLLRARRNGVFVCASTSSIQALSPSLILKGMLNHQVAVPALCDHERKMLYVSFLRQWTTLDETTGSRDLNFVRQTRGFRPRDLELLAFRTITFQSDHSSWKIHEATSKVLETYVPLSRLTSRAEDEVPSKYKLCDLGGLFQPKVALISTIVRPSLYSRIYAQAKVRLPRGVLLYGFSGTGKSMCIPALARECGYPLITCRGPELLDKYIGASEAKIRELFSRAAAAAPSILFFDELDALAPRRGSDHTGVTDRIVNQLLTFLDGVEDVSDSAAGRTVYVIGATSRPDKVDPALLRPGRLEKHIYFGLSEDLTEVKDLFLKISKSYRLNEEALSAVVSGEIVEKMSLTNPLFRIYSAADFTLIFQTAQLMAVRTALDASRTDDGPAVIHYQHLWKAICCTRPSVSEQDYQRLSEIYELYQQRKVLPSSSEEKQQMHSIMLTALK